MLADICKQPIHLLAASESGCLGAALYAGIGVGEYGDAHEAADRAVQITDTYYPNPDNFEAYDKAYKRFNDVYDALNGKIQVKWER